ncbi:MAG: hypothetical protein BGO14_00610 [Chlamydiales bacterium 38-26]|nr:ankyrin repeat domain-containing protein [Chlamydiales bacterium]OJV07224.1 MAG: hypothetical protein BGO14_00610 [Chlamydiales bacterium 38-26]
MEPTAIKKHLELDEFYGLEKFENFEDPTTDDLFIAIIQDVAEQHFERIKDLPLTTLEKAERKYHLTALHLCSMLQKIDLLKFLITRVHHLVPEDKDGWTPLHYAYLTQNADIIHILEENQVQRQPTSPTQAKFSCRQIQEMLSHKPAAEDQAVFHYQDPQTKQMIYNATARTFKELTGATFTSKTLVSGEYFLFAKSNLEKDKEEDSIQIEIEENYQTFEAHPPRLYLGQDTMGGWGVFADETIQSGAIVLHYAGETVISPSSSQYRTGVVDGMCKRNLGPMVNEGSPNLMPVHATIDHLPESIVFMALRKIEKGDQLLVDYGLGHGVKFYGPYINAGQKELEETLEAEGGLVRISHRLKAMLKQPFKSKKEFLVFERLRSLCAYTITTPPIFLDLLIKDKIQPADLQKIPFKTLKKLANLDNNIMIPALLHVILSDEHQRVLNQIKNLKNDQGDMCLNPKSWLLSLGAKLSISRRLYVHLFLSKINFPRAPLDLKFDLEHAIDEAQAKEEDFLYEKILEAFSQNKQNEIFK